MSQQQHTQDPVAWRITFKSGNEPDGLLTVHYHGTNAIADYREIDPAAKSDPLYTFPPDAAARIAELEKQRDTLLKLVECISQQTPEKPDYWSSCSQCEHNISDAEDAIASVKEKA